MGLFKTVSLSCEVGVQFNKSHSESDHIHTYCNALVLISSMKRWTCRYIKS